MQHAAGEPFTIGCGTSMTDRDLVRLYDAEVRARADHAAPGFRCEWDGPVLRMIGPDAEAFSNGVTYAKLDAANADAVIARQIAFFRGLGHAFEWKLFSYDEPADLAQRLRAAGFAPQDEETFVAFEVTREVAGPALATGVTIRRMDNPAEFGVIAMVNEAVYGDARHAQWLAEVIAEEKRGDPDSISVYAAFAGIEPISVGWMRHRRGDAFGSLWGGSTLPAWRGKGVYSGLVAARVAEARGRGCRYLTVDCSPMSLPILERRGFRRIATTTPFIWSPQ
jgi:GNAT superfamily N-acetyltransferase